MSLGLWLHLPFPLQLLDLIPKDALELSFSFRLHHWQKHLRFLLVSWLQLFSCYAPFHQFAACPIGLQPAPETLTGFQGSLHPRALAADPHMNNLCSQTSFMYMAEVAVCFSFLLQCLLPRCRPGLSSLGQ